MTSENINRYEHYFKSLSTSELGSELQKLRTQQGIIIN